MSFQAEVDELRKMNKGLDEELQTTKEIVKKVESRYSGDLASIRKELNRMLKNNQELEVNNGELKEEVGGIAWCAGK